MRKMFTARRKAIILLLFALLLGAFCREQAGGLPLRSEGKVRAVFDGDTVLLETGEKVRYLGIDAPEIGHNGEPSDCFGEKAGEANSKMVLGRKIELRYDGRTQDKYGRLLAYVFSSDGTCVNLEMVKSGNAWVYGRAEGFGMMPVFIEAQRDAIKNRRGLWDSCDVKPAAAYFGNRNTYVFHRAGCEWGSDMSARSKVRFRDRWMALNMGFSPCRVCKP
jgi:micrococcal nuclease